MKVVENFAEFYKVWLETIYNKYDFISSPRGMKIKEKINFSLGIRNIYENLFTNPIRSINLRYLAGELVWYFSGDNKINWINKFSKFWDKIKNKDNTLNSAYGNLIFKKKNKYGFTQWSWALKKLLEDKDTRQAILHFNSSEHQFVNNLDFVCTMYGIFLIRDNKLIFSIHMRSSDAILGITYDIPFFLLLQQIMYNELKKNYKDLELGNFYFIANSAHIYEKHFDLVSKMLKKSFKSEQMPEIRENPILNPNLKLIKKNKYKGGDEWLNWIQEKIYQF